MTKSSKKKSSRKRGSAKSGARGTALGGNYSTSSKSDDATNTVTHHKTFNQKACLSGLTHLRNAFPSSWRTTMTATATGQIALGGAATRTFTVDFASVFEPFDTATPFPTPLVAVGDYTPSAYNALLGGGAPYSSYRTFGSAISVMLQPLSILDVCTMLVFPTVTGPANFTAASQGRWVVKKECIANQRNTITNSCSVAAVSGDTPLAVATNSGFAAAYNAGPSLGAEWEIWLNLPAVNAAAIGYSVTVVYDVVLENPEYDSSDLNDVRTKPEPITPKLRKSMNALLSKTNKEEQSRLRSLALAAVAEDETSDELSSSSSSSASRALSSVSSQKKTLKK